ncbi:hypothetical protein, partial [Microcoleus sp. POL10_C6]|uniref:hypothetical protein n=1 Tax=Microcoleus sp. POL10_C6 TaxID=2818852 RepID=UPI002FD19FB2
IPSIVLWGDHFCLRAIVLFSLNSSYEIMGFRQLLLVKPAPIILDRSLELLQNFAILRIG